MHSQALAISGFIASGSLSKDIFLKRDSNQEDSVMYFARGFPGSPYLQGSGWLADWQADRPTKKVLLKTKKISAIVQKTQKPL